MTYKSEDKFIIELKATQQFYLELISKLIQIDDVKKKKEILEEYNSFLNAKDRTEILNKKIRILSTQISFDDKILFQRRLMVRNEHLSSLLLHSSCILIPKCSYYKTKEGKMLNMGALFQELDFYKKMPSDERKFELIKKLIGEIGISLKDLKKYEEEMKELEKEILRGEDGK